MAVLADIHFGPRIKGEGQHIRLSFATSTENIKEGLKRIKNYIDKYVSLDFSEIKNLHIKQLEIVKNYKNKRRALLPMGTVPKGRGLGR